MEASVTTPASNPVTLHYAVTRGELWDWYWWAWRRPRGLWAYWVFVAAVIFGLQVLDLLTRQSLTLSALGMPALIAFGAVLFFIVFPQLAYKPRERILIVNRDEIETSIGDMSAKRSWKDVAYVVVRPGYVALGIAGGIFLGPCWLRTLNGNAFVVPRRAFDSESDYRDFLQKVRAWHSAHVVRFPRFSRSRYYADN